MTITKKVFISHPYAGDPEANLARVDKVVKHERYNDCIVLSPLHMFTMYETETPELRRFIMEVCFHLIDIADEVHIYGRSPGCDQEKAYALSIGKKVVIFL